MLRVTTCVSSAAAKQYFARGDYYSQGRQIEATWGGRAATALGLSGTVEQEHFEALCDNLHPATGERLTARMKDGRRAGYDFTFNAPKSISIAYALGGDDRILEALNQAVAETMQEVEAEAAARVRKGGRQTDRVTGNLAWASFVHHESRPLEDGIPDPHLHIHCFVANATFDPEEKTWKALQLGEVLANAPYYESVFHSHLSARLASVGYGIERTAKGGWEIAGVSRSTIDKFSRRTQQIEEFAAERGITDPEQLDGLGAKTRRGKQTSLSQKDRVYAYTREPVLCRGGWADHVGQRPGLASRKGSVRLLSRGESVDIGRTRRPLAAGVRAERGP